jgi:glycosyltransferase involved in cell wall biosynthesis
MRIAFLDSWLQSTAEGSGTAAGIGGLRQALIRRGHTVDRLAPVGPWPQNLTARRIWFNAQLPALLNKPNYHLIVGHDIDGFLWSLRRREVPYIASIKGVIAEEARHERGNIHRLLWSLSRLEKINARNADGVLTTSAYCRSAIGRHYGVSPGRVRLVPEGINLDYWRRISRENPRQSDGATILCVARQYPRKHVADLLAALPAVRKAVPNARTIIVGDGPEHATLRHLAAQLRLSDAVQFTGAIPDDAQVARLYRQADVFCLPSVQEGFGIVFLEAMASGLPVVSTTAAAIPEVVPDRQAGRLVAPSNPAELANALIELLSDEQQRRAYGQFGSEYVAQFDWDHVAAIFLAQVEPFVQADHACTPTFHPFQHKHASVGTD